MASAWDKRRAYEPGGPLYAMRPLRFNGVDYAKGAALPVEEMTPAKHVTLWRSGKASHARPPGRVASTASIGAAPSASPAPSPSAPPPGARASAEPAPQEARAPLDDQAGGQLFRKSPSETVHVETPRQQHERRKHRR